ncbi:MAG: hypothetical protein ACI932_001802 [Paracoccaceae bacterium]|jgi:hypothetical protein
MDRVLRGVRFSESFSRVLQTIFQKWTPNVKEPRKSAAPLNAKT